MKKNITRNFSGYETTKIIINTLCVDYIYIKCIILFHPIITILFYLGNINVVYKKKKRLCYINIII